MSQTSYDNVPLYTGIPVPQDNNGFFQPPAPSAEGLLATDQARAVVPVHTRRDIRLRPIHPPCRSGCQSLGKHELRLP